MAYNTIKLTKYLDIVAEYDAASTITPGMLIELGSGGTVAAHATAGGNVLPMFALEDELQGHDIEDQFAAGDEVQCWVPVRGDIVYAILADGQDVSIGDSLESAGNGYLQKHTADLESWESGSKQEAGSITVYGNQIVGIALEAKDLSGSSGEEDSSGVLGYNKRIKVRIA